MIRRHLISATADALERGNSIRTLCTVKENDPHFINDHQAK